MHEYLQLVYHILRFHHLKGLYFVPLTTFLQTGLGTQTCKFTSRQRVKPKTYLSILLFVKHRSLLHLIHISCSKTLWGSLERSGWKTFTAIEKSRSTGADVAGTDKYFSHSVVSFFLYFSLFIFQYLVVLSSISE